MGVARAGECLRTDFHHPGKAHTRASRQDAAGAERTVLAREAPGARRFPPALSVLLVRGSGTWLRSGGVTRAQSEGQLRPRAGPGPAVSATGSLPLFQEKLYPFVLMCTVFSEEK